MKYILGFLLLALSLLAAGCQTSARGGQRAGASNEDAALESHLATLEAQITKLEQDLGKGRGAYRDGSLLRVEGKDRGEPPLDRLRRLERELADAKAQIASRDARIAEIGRDLAAARDQGKSLGEQASDLAYARDALVTAQQALAESRGEADGLRAQLATSELQRLKAEREHYRFAARLLHLAAGQTTQLFELQEDVRESARALGTVGNAPAPEKSTAGEH